MYMLCTNRCRSPTLTSDNGHSAQAGMAKGGDLVRKATTRIGEEYHLGTLVPKHTAASSGPWDCAELVSWCVFQVSNRLYGCNNDHANPAGADAYTGYWQRDAGTLGRVVTVDVAAQTPGAAVLRFP